MTAEDLLNIAGTIISWYVTATNTAWTFINTHGWYVAAVGVGIILVGSVALNLTRRRRARLQAPRTPAEKDRERTQ